MKQSLSKSSRSRSRWSRNSWWALALVLAPAIAASYALQGSPKPKKPQVAPPPIRPSRLPQLGDDVPAALLKQSPAAKLCETGDGRHEPCTTLTIRHDDFTDRITIAWDSSTKRITYLYSTTLITDDDIRAGDVLPIDSTIPVTPLPIASIPHRFVSPEWCDTVVDLSGITDWCAVMVPARPRSGRVLGFVQSAYLYLPNIDTEPMHRTSLSRPHHRLLSR
jgi:hypothetical protein